MALKKNEAQEKAIQTIYGPVLLISCPGSGKTTTLVRRIHHMIQSGINPNEILMVTFSKAAAIEMKQKYIRLFNSNPGVSFQTIHSLCLNLLTREHKYSHDDILPEEEKIQFLFDQAKELGDYAGDPYDMALSIATEIGVIKNNYISMRGYTPTSCDKGSFLAIYKSYEKWKERSHRIDFDDILIFCKEMLENESDICDKWSSHFKYIQCDEYQDTNYIQRDILYLLSGKNRNLCVVGDDDQSIYRFRGARPEIMQDFSKDFPDAKVINMSINYRSADEIVRHSDALIRHNTVRFDKDFISQRGIDGTAGSVDYIRTGGKTEQTDTLINKIIALHKEGIPYNDMAVLFRTNHEISGFVPAFSRKEIPFYSLDTVTCIYDGWIFKDIRTYVDLSSGKWKNASDRNRKIISVLNRPNRYFNTSAFEGIDYTLDDFRDAIYPLHKEDGWKYNSALKHINTWMKSFGPGVITYQSDIDDLIQSLHGTGSIHYEKYLKETAKFRNQDPEEYTSQLEELLTDAKQFDTVGEWFKYAEKTSMKIQESNKMKNENGIVLSTMHRSKGLEWNTVFIVNCYEGMIPHRESTGKEETEEERRLFYVAMTRARDHLYVLNPKKDDSPFAKEADLMTDSEKRKAKAVPKYLPGKPVIHRGFGSGNIVSYSEDYVFVRFKSGTKKLKFPETFLDGIIKYV